MAVASPPDVAGRAQLARAVHHEIEFHPQKNLTMPAPTTTLTVRKTLPCPPETAFRAWTDPQLFQQWFAPDPAMSTVAEVDLRPGGKYRIGFQPPGGKPTMFVGGEFLKINAPRHLEYTWVWEKETDP